MSASDRAFVSYSSPASSSSSTRRTRTAASSARSEEHIDDVDATMPQQDVLIPPWSATHRSSRPPALPSASNSVERGSPNPAILPLPNNLNLNNGQDVRTRLLNGSRTLLNTSSLYQNVQQSGIDILRAPTNPNPQNASLNTLNNRLRTPLPVFDTTTEQLAAHYGLPRRLPLPPRINSTNNTRPPVPTFNESISPLQPCPSSSDSPVDLQYLMSNYLGMLSTNPDETRNTTLSQSPAAPMNNSFPGMEQSAAEEAANDLAQMLLATPDMWNEYLTSPFDESPLELPLETPAQGSAELSDFFTSPAVADINNFEPFGDLPLFPQYAEQSSEDKMPVAALSAQPATDAVNLDGLLQMSPATPALDASPLVEDSSNLDKSIRTKYKIPTGTRKNITPESLVPIDAPTQPRNYVLPSQTSRKEVPAVFARKRARSTAFGDEEDELVEDADGQPTQSEAEAIAAKRRQNTLAARRSRKRKLEYQKQLEERLELEQKEKEMWKNRAIMLQSQLEVAIGMKVPFPDE